MALDASPSVVGFESTIADGVPSYTPDVENFAVSLVNAIPVNADDANVGILVFDEGILLQRDLSSDQSTAAANAGLYDTVATVGDTNGTNIALALNRSQALLQSGRDGVPKVIVLLTDGDNTSPTDSESSAFATANSSSG